MAPKHCHNRSLKPGNGCSGPSAHHCMCPGCSELVGARQVARAENGPSGGAGKVHEGSESHDKALPGVAEQLFWERK